MNWGNRILLLYLAFVALIITLVVFSFSQKVDLVSPDYYARELNFESDIIKMKNEAALVEKPKVILSNEQLQISFPTAFKDKKITGTVLVYKPSDANEDYTQAIDCINGVLVIAMQDFTAGMRKVKISWKVDSLYYLTESVIVIP
jgi:hypothetical protein